MLHKLLLVPANMTLRIFMNQQDSEEIFHWVNKYCEKNKHSGFTAQYLTQSLKVTPVRKRLSDVIKSKLWCLVYNKFRQLLIELSLPLLHVSKYTNNIPFQSYNQLFIKFHLNLKIYIHIPYTNESEHTVVLRSIIYKTILSTNKNFKYYLLQYCVCLFVIQISVVVCSSPELSKYFT